MTAAWNWLQGTVIASLMGSVAGGLLWLWFRCVKRMSPTAQYYLWFAALLACVLPVRIAWQAPAAAAPLQEITVHITEAVTHPLPPPQAAGVPQVAWGDVLAAVWLVIACALYGRHVLGYLLAARRLRRATEVGDCPLLAQFTRRRVRVRVGEAVSSPLLLGLFRPTLYLPTRPLEEEQLRHVLAHETVHLHRGDLWLKQAALAVRCLCWFNPAVYGLYRRFTALCEISCDVTAVRKTGGDTASYLATVLYLMCTGHEPSDRLTTAMASDPRRVKERFAAVSRCRPRRAVTVAAVTAAVVLLAGAVCTGGVIAGRETAPMTTLQPPTPTFSDVTVEDTTETADGLRWPLLQKEGAVSSTYGYRWGELHRGVDMTAAEGDTVVAAAAGKVIACETQAYNGGYGLAVVIDHGDGLSTLYAHLDSIAVSEGTFVEAGETIGAAGMTGDITGPCLHFEVRENGEAVDPLSYIAGLSLIDEGEYDVYWTEYVDEFPAEYVDEFPAVEMIIDGEEKSYELK